MDVFEEPLDEGRRAPTKVQAEILEKTDFFDYMTDIEVLELFGLDELVKGGAIGG